MGIELAKKIKKNYDADIFDTSGLISMLEKFVPFPDQFSTTNPHLHI